MFPGRGTNPGDVIQWDGSKWTSSAFSGGLTAPINPTDDGKLAAASAGDLTYTNDPSVTSITLSSHVAAGAGTLATAGTVRLSNASFINWRDQANTTNYGITLDASDQLILTGGSVIITPNTTAQGTLHADLALSSGTSVAAPFAVFGGGTTASAGDIRLRNTGSIYFRNFADTADYGVSSTAGNELEFTATGGIRFIHAVTAVSTTIHADGVLSSSTSVNAPIANIGGGTLASAGVIRMPNNVSVFWRNVGDTADLGITVDSSNKLVLSGSGGISLANAVIAASSIQASGAVFSTGSYVAGTFLTNSTGVSASTGFIRLNNNHAINWRDAGNTADYGIVLNASDVLAFTSSSAGFTFAGGTLTSSVGTITPYIDVGVTATALSGEIRMADLDTITGRGTGDTVDCDILTWYGTTSNAVVLGNITNIGVSELDASTTVRLKVAGTFPAREVVLTSTALTVGVQAVTFDQFLAAAAVIGYGTKSGSAGLDLTLAAQTVTDANLGGDLILTSGESSITANDGEFRLQRGGIDYLISGSGYITIDSASGTAPTSGTLRLTSGSDVFMRGTSANVKALSTSSNLLVVGSTVASESAGVTISAATSTVITLTISTTDVIFGESLITSEVPTFQFTSGVTTPGINQASDTTATATGDLFTIHAQDCTGATNTTGGALIVRAGNATGAGGTHVGGDLTVHGGDATGASGSRFGGDITVRSGTGANAVGTVYIQAGTTTRIECDPTGIGFFTATPVAKPTVTGAKGSNVALGSLCTALANLGLITDSTSA